MEITWGKCPRVPKENGGLAADALLSEPLRNGLGRKKMAGAAADMPDIGVFVDGFLLLGPHNHKSHNRDVCVSL